MHRTLVKMASLCLVIVARVFVLATAADAQTSIHRTIFSPMEMVFASSVTNHDEGLGDFADGSTTTKTFPASQSHEAEVNSPVPEKPGLRMEFDYPRRQNRPRKNLFDDAYAGSFLDLSVSVRPAAVAYKPTEWKWPDNITITVGVLDPGLRFSPSQILFDDMQIRYYVPLPLAKQESRWRIKKQDDGPKFRFPEYNFRFFIPAYLTGQLLAFRVSYTRPGADPINSFIELAIRAPQTEKEIEEFRTSFVTFATKTGDYERALISADSLIALGWRSKEGLMAAVSAANSQLLRYAADHYLELFNQTFGAESSENGGYRSAMTPASSAPLQTSIHDEYDDGEFANPVSEPNSEPSSLAESAAIDSLRQHNRIERFIWRKTDYQSVFIRGLLRANDCNDGSYEKVAQFLEDYHALFGLQDPMSQLNLRAQSAGPVVFDLDFFNSPFIRYHFDQIYHGVPVENGSVTVTITRDSPVINKIAAHVLPDLDLDPTPKLNMAQIEGLIKDSLTIPDYPCTISASKLRVLSFHGQVHLAWVVEFACKDSTNQQRNERALFDAQTGEQLIWYRMRPLPNSARESKEQESTNVFQPKY